MCEAPILVRDSRVTELLMLGLEEKSSATEAAEARQAHMGCRRYLSTAVTDMEHDK